MTHFDTLILGGGQGGGLARILAEGGQKVAIIEREHFGGTCLNVGCTPSKAHISAAKRAHDARTASALGIHAQVTVDFPAVVARTQSIVHTWRAHIVERLENLENLTIFRGQGQFNAEKQLEVRAENGETQTISASNIVVAVGASPEIPAINGIETVPYLTNRTLFELKTLPAHLIILGGGYIACEMAQCFQRLGAQVTIIQKGAQILGHESGDVSEAIAEFLRAEGIEIRLNQSVKAVKSSAEEVEITTETATIRASHLLLATGQTPNTRGIGLENLGVKIGEKGEIQVNQWLEAAPGVWAMGDCKGGPAFTHIAYDDARHLADRLLKNERRSIENRVVPYVVFTDPQLGRVGLSEAQARAKNLKFRVGKLPVCDTARGAETGETTGFLKVLVGEDDQILGGALLARDGGEVMAVLQIAMQAQWPFQKLRDNVFAHPTQTESFNRVFAALK